MLTQWVVLWKYVGMVIWPMGQLSFEHLYGPLNHITDFRILIATGLYAILWIGLRRTLKSSWDHGRFVIFGVLWFLITISPTSSVFPTTATMAENRVYLPLVGFCLILLLIGNDFIRRLASERWRTPIMLAIFGVYILSLGYITRHRNVLYQDPVKMWMEVIRKYPDHERAHKNLAIEYAQQGQINKAMEENEKALALDPHDVSVRNTLAMIYFKQGRYNEALKIFLEIVKEKPDFGMAYANMGLVYGELDNMDAAVNAFQMATRIDPTLVGPLWNLGNIYLAKGRPKEAAASYQAALRLAPQNAQLLKLYEKAADTHSYE